MSPDLALGAACASPDVLPSDRRSHQRYPIELDLRYKLIHRRQVLNGGVGKTRDISTKGVFFSADQALAKGLDVELLMDWPFRLGGLCPLEGKIAGDALRGGDSVTAGPLRGYDVRKTSAIHPQPARTSYKPQRQYS